MGNRLLRSGILDSDKVNSLGWAAEVFFRRLMSVADDFGRYDGRVSMLRSYLYPVKLEDVSIEDVTMWLKECVDAKVIQLYTVDGKPYLEILNFGQKLRAKKSKYPENGKVDQNENTCSTHVVHMSDTCTLEEKRRETEVELEEETEGELLTPSQEQSRYEYVAPGQKTHSGPARAEVEMFFRQNGHTMDFAEKFFLRYESTSWMISGTPITNWRSVALNWFRDPDKYANKGAPVTNSKPGKYAANWNELQKAKEITKKLHESRANKDG
jgi:hypothetical protein